MYTQFTMFTFGSYSSRLWTTILAITLLLLQCRSLCFVLKLWPVFVSAILLDTIYMLIIDRLWLLANTGWSSMGCARGLGGGFVHFRSEQHYTN